MCCIAKECYSPFNPIGNSVHIEESPKFERFLINHIKQGLDYCAEVFIHSQKCFFAPSVAETCLYVSVSITYSLLKKVND